MIDYYYTHHIIVTAIANKDTAADVDGAAVLVLALLLTLETVPLPNSAASEQRRSNIPLSTLAAFCIDTAEASILDESS